LQYGKADLWDSSLGLVLKSDSSWCFAHLDLKVENSDLKAKDVDFKINSEELILT